MANIVIYATSNSDQDGIIITDQTDWTALGVPRSTITSIDLSLYGASLVTPETTYSLTAGEVSDFVTNGEVELMFIDIDGVIYLDDGWWTIKLSCNSGDYVSNFSGFGIYASITGAVFSLVNSLHTPADTKYVAEKYAIPVLFLEGLKYTDTTNVNSRSVLFSKNLTRLEKMLLKI